MKKLLPLFIFEVLTLSVLAQAPEKMSYQAVIRNVNGALVANQAVGMRISILPGSTTGTPVYVETHLPTTNANGLVTIEIGGGNIVAGVFTGIDWSNGTYFIKTETDPSGGTDYTITGTSQLLSVPYALHSKNAETAADKAYVDALLIKIQQLQDNAIRTGFYVADVQGNLYSVIKIGKQVWMKVNLMTTKYNNGDPIPNVKDNAAWSGLTSGAYCFYNNDSINYASNYSALYNYYVIMDSRNICPTGWHVPTASDWEELVVTLGGSDVAGGKMKWTQDWNIPNTGANNSSGFLAMPSGHRKTDGQYQDLKLSCSWWISPVDNSDHGWAHTLYYNSAADEFNESVPLNVGYSVRCIQD